MAIERPGDRLRRALAELYSWYGETEDMLSNVTRDAARTPATGSSHTSSECARRSWRAAAARPRAPTGRGSHRHATGFATWKSLVREQGLDQDDAVALMVSMVDAAAPR